MGGKESRSGKHSRAFETKAEYRPRSPKKKRTREAMVEGPGGYAGQKSKKLPSEEGSNLSKGGGNDSLRLGAILLKKRCGTEQVQLMKRIKGCPEKNLR